MIIVAIPMRCVIDSVSILRGNNKIMNFEKRNLIMSSISRILIINFFFLISSTPLNEAHYETYITATVTLINIQQSFIYVTLMISIYFSIKLQLAIIITRSSRFTLSGQYRFIVESSSSCT